MKYRWPYYVITMLVILLFFGFGTFLSVIVYNYHPVLGLIAFIVLPVRWAFELFMAAYLQEPNK